MCMNKTQEAREFLEGQQAGAFAALLEQCLGAGGGVHLGADCFVAWVPCGDDEGCVHVVFQCSELRALRRVLVALGYERVEWRRDYGHGERYGTRKRAVADFCRHESFGLRFNDK